jgi:hypothetical protein
MIAEWIACILDVGILIFVALEYYESRELNHRLNRVYKAKKKKLNADKIIKEVLNQEVK